MPRRVVVAVTGASGAVYGVRLLRHLRAAGGVETHVVVSHAGALSAFQEVGIKRAGIEALADVAYGVSDIGAAIASGSFAWESMVIAPCSGKTLAAVACGFADNLITRAADVTLKERRRLVLLVREAPLHAAHLRNMQEVTQMGGIVFPPVPAFYHRPRSIEELVDQTIARVLDLIGVEHQLAPRWRGVAAPEGGSET